MLKCPICVKEYSYESKVCKECEDYLEYSGLATLSYERAYKGAMNYK